MKEKGWLDPWGEQHELLCDQYMADEAVMGYCTCRKLKALCEQIAREVVELDRRIINISARSEYTDNREFVSFSEVLRAIWGK